MLAAVASLARSIPLDRIAPADHPHVFVWSDALMPHPAEYDIGLYPTLTLTREQIATLTAEDVAEIRDYLGATDAMLDDARRLAADGAARVVFDFEHQTVADGGSRGCRERADVSA